MSSPRRQSRRLQGKESGVEWSKECHSDVVVTPTKESTKQCAPTITEDTAALNTADTGPNRALELAPSLTIWFLSTQWPHVVLYSHSAINGGGLTNLYGGLIFIATYALSTRYILTHPTASMTVAAYGLWAVPYYGGLLLRIHPSHVARITIDPSFLCSCSV